MKRKIMIIKEQFEKLVQFDATKIEHGQDIIINYYGKFLKTSFIGLSKSGKIVSESDGDRFHLTDESNVRLAPLFWLEGNPIRCNDMVYTHDGYALIVAAIESDIVSFCNSTVRLHISKLSFTKQKQKKYGWVNVYKTSCGTVLSEVHRSEAIAVDKMSDVYRSSVNCVDTVFIEWEE